MLAEHHIDTGKHPAIRFPPYWLPQALKNTVQMEIEEMLKHGIIEPSKSAQTSTPIPMRKKEKSLRLCVDYRRLNVDS